MTLSINVFGYLERQYGGLIEAPNKMYERATRAGIAGLEFAVVSLSLSLYEHEIVTYWT